MFEFPFRVAYIDTDAMGIVHHSRYYRYLEQCRVEWLRSIGVSYKQMEEEGVLLPLTAASMEYKKPLRFDEEAVVRSHIAENGKTQFDIHYEIWVDGELRSTAITRHVYIKKMVGTNGLERWKPLAVPAEWKEKWPKPLKPKS